MNQDQSAGHALPQALLEQHANHPLLPAYELATGFSRFLTRSLSKDDGLAEWLLEHPLSKAWRKDEIAGDIARQIETGLDEDALHYALRFWRRRYMAMIAWADLAGVYAMEDTTAAVSELADTLIDTALSQAYRWQVERFGEPIGHSGEVSRMVVLGLGKLGGTELNFSSDVDLIFAFSEGGETNGPRQLSNEEFYTRLGRRLIKLLDEATAEGFVFRIDMRLRPNGGVGPLALSFDAMEHYYQTHGRDWERYAWIKARVVAGDKDAGANLLKSLRPFVYRKYLDFSAFESIREMKQLIDRELERKGRQNNIKLGRGGIREVEFIVQCHQLIRGGRESDLQTSRLKQALDALTKLEIVDSSQAEALYDAYTFLRNTEHRLQMQDDRQTQLLPEDENERMALAETMGFESVQSFTEQLDRHTRLVHDEFSGLFEARDDDGAQSQDDYSDIWFGSLEEPDAINLLDQKGYKDAGHCHDLIKGIREGRVYLSFSRNGRERLDRLMPLALSRISATHNADESLIRFITIVEGIGRRSAYFLLLEENPIALKQLIDLISASAWITRWISQHPVILDELLDPISNAAMKSKTELINEIERRLKPVFGDMEAEMDLLREYKNSYMLRIAAMETAGILAPDKVRLALSDLAEAILTVLVSVAEGSLTAKIKAEVENCRDQLEFGIVAYGKLGSQELSYGSDLDLVFVFDTPGNPALEATASFFFSRLTQRILHYLSTTTRAGVLYETDIRLRPSGRSGTMVSSLRAFTDYQVKQAWTWEHQALVRSRMIACNGTLETSFESRRREILCVPRSRLQLQTDVIDMRLRMSDANNKSSDTEFDLKLGEGGLVDIEFLVQFLVLLHAVEHGDIIEPRSTVLILSALSDAGLIPAEEAAAISAIYRDFLALELKLKLQERPALIPIDAAEESRKRVRQDWDEYVVGVD